MLMIGLNCVLAGPTIIVCVNFLLLNLSTSIRRGPYDTVNYDRPPQQDFWPCALLPDYWSIDLHRCIWRSLSVQLDSRGMFRGSIVYDPHRRGTTKLLVGSSNGRIDNKDFPNRGQSCAQRPTNFELHSSEIQDTQRKEVGSMGVLRRSHSGISEDIARG